MLEMISFILWRRHKIFRYF